MRNGSISPWPCYIREPALVIPKVLVTNRVN